MMEGKKIETKIECMREGGSEILVCREIEMILEEKEIEFDTKRKIKKRGGMETKIPRKMIFF